MAILNKISANDVWVMLIKVDRTFGEIIVLKVYHLDRLSHNHCTANVVALYIDPDYFSQHWKMPCQWSSALFPVFLQVHA